MANILWSVPEALTTALDTGLNGLTTGSISAASAAIDNITGTALYPYMTVELFLPSLTPTGQPYCNLYLAASIDSSNFEDITVSAYHAVIASFPMSTATAAKRIVVKNILIPPYQFKLALENQTGTTFAGTLNTVKFRRHNLVI